MTIDPGLVEQRMAADAEQDRRARQERHQAAQERADALAAREARWLALSEQERLRLAIVAHRRGMDPRELMDSNDQEESNDA